MALKKRKTNEITQLVLDHYRNGDVDGFDPGDSMGLLVHEVVTKLIPDIIPERVPLGRRLDATIDFLRNMAEEAESLAYCLVDDLEKLGGPDAL